ncbi:uncharacterized protein LOC144128559 [Amblyomma americanum]
MCSSGGGRSPCEEHQLRVERRTSESHVLARITAPDSEQQLGEAARDTRCEGGWRVGWQERVTVAAREEPPAMPFIEDDLLWCPNTDGKMVDLSCLDSGPNVLVEPQGDVLQELTHTDLHGLGIDEEEEILRQLNDPGFEIDAIFADLHEPQGAPTAVAVAPLPPLMQPQDDAVGISRKRRRRRSDDAPPGCSGLQQPSFHSVGTREALA